VPFAQVGVNLMANKLASGWDISSVVLSPRQLKAGMKIIEAPSWIELTTKNGSRVAIMPKNSDNLTIQRYADNYLNEIDWQE
jgi:hypothetical protein